MAADRKGAIVVLAAAVFGAGCAHGGLPELPRARWESAARWPPAPNPPRIVRVGAIRSEQDVQISRGLLGWLGDTVLGEDEGLRLVRPVGVAVETGRRLVVADPGLPAVVVFDLRTGRTRALVRTAAGALRSPIGVALDGAGRLFVSDSALGVVAAFDAGGRCLWTTPPGALARPTGLAVDPGRGRLYVVDTLAHAVVLYDLEGRRLGRFGTRGDAVGELNFPVFAALAPGGDLFVTDAMNGRIQRFAPDGRVRGTLGRRGDVPGTFTHPKGVAPTAEGRVLVADSVFDNVQLFDAAGRLLLVFGTHGAGDSGLALPEGIAVDGEGRVFVADSLNHRVQIFRTVPEAP